MLSLKFTLSIIVFIFLVHVVKSQVLPVNLGGSEVRSYYPGFKFLPGVETSKGVNKDEVEKSPQNVKRFLDYKPLPIRKISTPAHKDKDDTAAPEVETPHQDVGNPPDFRPLPKVVVTPKMEFIDEPKRKFVTVSTNDDVTTLIETQYEENQYIDDYYQSTQPETESIYDITNVHRKPAQLVFINNLFSGHKIIDNVLKNSK